MDTQGRHVKIHAGRAPVLALSKDGQAHPPAGKERGRQTREVATVLGARPLLLICLLWAGCADFHGTGAVVPNMDMTDPERAEDAIRGFFGQIARRWNEVEKVWSGQGMSTDSPDASEPFEGPRDMLENEYAKFWGNAIMLFLRGDWSTDLERSMHSLRTIVLNGESATGCGAGRDISVPEIGGYTTGMFPVPHSAEREFLYRAKSYWDDMNVRVNSRQIHLDLPEKDVRTLTDLNDRFHVVYGELLQVYLGGSSGGSELENSFADLEAMRLEAQRVMEP